MQINTRLGDVEVRRKSYSEDFYLKITFTTVDDKNVLQSNTIINTLIEDRVGGRKDITQSVIQEAVDSFMEDLDNSDVTGIKAIDVVSEQRIRQTPYEARTED